MRSFKGNLLVQFSAVSLVTMTLIGVTIALVLSDRLAVHIALMDTLLSPKSQSLNNDINSIREITLWMVGVGFVILYSCLVFVVWRGWKTIARQRTQLESLSDENAQLYQQAKSEMELVDDVAKVMTSTLDLGEVYERFAIEAKRLLDFDRMAFNIINHDGSSFKSRHVYGAVLSGNPEDALFSIENTQTGQVLKTGTMLVRADITEGTRYRSEASHIASGLRSSILVPVIANGRIIATLGLRSKSIDAYRLREQAILERLAKQIAPAIENANLYDQAKREMVAIDEVSRIVTGTLVIDEIYEQFASEVKKLVDFDRMAISRIDEEAGTYAIKHVVGPEVLGGRIGDVALLAGSVIEEVISSGRAVVRQDLAAELGIPGAKRFLEVGLHSHISVPLIFQGRIIGTLGLRSYSVGAFGQRELAIAERLANQIAPALGNSLLYEETVRGEQALRSSESQIQHQAEILRSTNRELTRANDAKREFLAHMSHELRTPLNGMLGFARLLTEPGVGPINEKQKRYLANIETDGMHLLTLINDIIEISKIEAGKMDLNISRIDVRDCLTSCYSIAAGMASNKDINFRAMYPPANRVIYGDERKIKELLLNLLSNAIKFTPEGGTVILNGSVTDDELRISVIDSGIGIDAQYQERIFETFEQGDPEVAKAYGGSGLGLQLVQQMVNLHNGKVWVESTIGKGSTFCVALPLAPGLWCEKTEGECPSSESDPSASATDNFAKSK